MITHGRPSPRRPRRGLTLVEALLSLILGALLLGAFLTVWRGMAHRSHRSHARLDLAERVHRVLLGLRREARQVRHYTLAPAAGALSLRIGDHWVRYVHDPSTGALHRGTDEEPAEVLLEGVDFFAAQEDAPGLIHITLVLKDSDGHHTYLDDILVDPVFQDR